MTPNRYGGPGSRATSLAAAMVIVLAGVLAGAGCSAAPRYGDPSTHALLALNTRVYLPGWQGVAEHKADEAHLQGPRGEAVLYPEGGVLAAGDLPPGEYRLEAVVAYLKGPGDFGAYQFILPDEPWTRITVRAGTFVFGGRLVVNPEQSYSLEKVRMLLETTPAAEQAARQTLARRLRHSPWGKVLAHPPPAPPADPHFSPQPTPQPSAGEIRGEICNMTPYFGG